MSEIPANMTKHIKIIHSFHERKSLIGMEVEIENGIVTSILLERNLAGTLTPEYQGLHIDGGVEALRQLYDIIVSANLAVDHAVREYNEYVTNTND